MLNFNPEVWTNESSGGTNLPFSIPVWVHVKRRKPEQGNHSV
jgi:hypothetical protein